MLRLTLKHTTHNQQYDPQILAKKNAKNPWELTKKLAESERQSYKYSTSTKTQESIINTE